MFNNIKRIQNSIQTLHLVRIYKNTADFLNQKSAVEYF